MCIVSKRPEIVDSARNAISIWIDKHHSTILSDKAYFILANSKDPWFIPLHLFSQWIFYIFLKVRFLKNIIWKLIAQLNIKYIKVSYIKINSVKINFQKLLVIDFM